MSNPTPQPETRTVRAGAYLITITGDRVELVTDPWNEYRLDQIAESTLMQRILQRLTGHPVLGPAAPEWNTPRTHF